MLDHSGGYLDRDVAARSAEHARHAAETALLLRIWLLIGGSGERLC